MPKIATRTRNGPSKKLPTIEHSVEEKIFLPTDELILYDVEIEMREHKDRYKSVCHLEKFENLPTMDHTDRNIFTDESKSMISRSSILAEMSNTQVEIKASHPCKLHQRYSDSIRIENVATNSKTLNSKDSKNSISTRRRRGSFCSIRSNDTSLDKSGSFKPKKPKILYNLKKDLCRYSDGPMQLSRRMSFKLTRPGVSPLSSPITAQKLSFSPELHTSKKLIVNSQKMSNRNTRGVRK